MSLFAYVEVGAFIGIWCGTCGRVSFNPNDLDHRYCGHCHESLTDEVKALGAVSGVRRMSDR
jgi:uncharacterized OB-fold protein